MADKGKLLKKTDYNMFLSRLKNEIITARQQAYKTVNRQLVELYLHIGESIYEKVEVSRWGQGIVETLSQDLRRAIVTNLKEFFLELGSYFAFIREEYKINVGN